MNIFATNPDPGICAISLDDKRVLKMTVETSQMLSTARPHLKLMKPAFVNHPSTKWVMSSPHNFCWLWYHLWALHGEYQFRYNRTHSLSFMVELLEPEHNATPEAASLFPKLTRDVNRGLDFRHIEDVHESYRFYLRGKWATDRRPVYFTKRGAPKWL